MTRFPLSKYTKAFLTGNAANLCWQDNVKEKRRREDLERSLSDSERDRHLFEQRLENALEAVSATATHKHLLEETH